MENSFFVQFKIKCYGIVLNKKLVVKFLSTILTQMILNRLISVSINEARFCCLFRNEMGEMELSFYSQQHKQDTVNIYDGPFLAKQLTTANRWLFPNNFHHIYLARHPIHLNQTQIRKELYLLEKEFSCNILNIYFYF